VLDPALVVVRERKGRPDLWETGTPEARAAWDAYGEAVRAEGLVWGGSWKMRDLPHSELLDFRSKKWD
jgi:hypothetical protein